MSVLVCCSHGFLCWDDCREILCCELGELYRIVRLCFCLVVCICDRYWSSCNSVGCRIFCLVFLLVCCWYVMDRFWIWYKLSCGSTMFRVVCCFFCGLFCWCWVTFFLIVVLVVCGMDLWGFGWFWWLVWWADCG